MKLSSKIMPISRPRTSHKYPAILTKYAWSINDLSYGQIGNFFLVGPIQEIPSKNDAPILPTPLAYQNTGLASSCPLADTAT